MLRFGVFVRFLMLLLCAVPFTSAQQAGAVLAPTIPFTPAPPGPAPAPGTTSEEDDEREADSKERLSDPSKHRLPARERSAHHVATRTTHLPHLPHARTTPPVAADPFRNGLGSPYRC